MRLLADCDTIIEAMERPDIFGRYFSDASWFRWKVFIKLLYGLPLGAREVAFYRKYTGRSTPSLTPFREAWALVGRRGGKSQTAALIAVWQACSRDWTDELLGPGGVGTVPIVAADRKQSRTILRYIKGLIGAVPSLKAAIVTETKESLELSNRIVFEIHTASFKSTRGYTVVSALADEIAFWKNEESASPDIEILNALRPAMSTIPSAVLLCISTVYARRGETWYAYRDHFGKDGDPLVWRARSIDMNPLIDVSVIAKAKERDDVAASAEYDSVFRADLETFLSEEQLQRVVLNASEIGPRTGVRYVAFCDPAGGGGQDSMTIGIAHREGKNAVLDFVREVRPPFNPKDVTAMFAADLRRYWIRSVQGDRYAGDWPTSEFKDHGITYTASELIKSEIYLTLLPLVTSQSVQLLRVPRLLAQFRGLERRTARGGHDSVDHGPMGHDDVSNAAAGALLLASGVGGVPTPAAFAATRPGYRRSQSVAASSPFAGRAGYGNLDWRDGVH